ncbi:MAG: SIMPL domain-containing protein [Candidatus Omnitrophota bacterium]
MRKGVVVIVAAVIFAVSFILVANILSNAAISIKNKGYVKVKGFAKQEIKSDLAIFEVTILEENPDLKLCHKNLSGNKKTVSDYIDKFLSKPKGDIVKFSPININEKYKINERGYDTDEFVEFQLNQSVSVESKDVEKIQKISQEISELIDDGVKMSISYPGYYYTKLDDLKIEMIGLATANAKERAQIIAKKGKFKLGPVASVRVGVFQITPANSTSVDDYGINDTSSIDKEIKSVVEIEYFVK